MNRLAFIALAVCCLGVLAGCGDNAGGDGNLEDDFLREVRQNAAIDGGSEANTTALQPGGRNPKIELETDHFQMGPITFKAPSVSEMKVYNRGGSSLRVTRITTSCMCTTGKMQNDVIPPGGVGILEITVDPSRIQGFFTTKTLTLFTNDPLNPHTTLDVTTTVQAEAGFEPELFELGEIKQGVGAEVVVRIRQLQDYPLAIDSVGVFEDSPFFRARLEDVPESEWRAPGKREFSVTAKMLPGTPVGNYTKVIMVHSSLKYQPSIALPIMVSVIN